MNQRPLRPQRSAHTKLSYTPTQNILYISAAFPSSRVIIIMCHNLQRPLNASQLSQVVNPSRPFGAMTGEDYCVASLLKSKHLYSVVASDSEAIFPGFDT